MVLAPFQSFEDYLEENPPEDHSSRIYVPSPPVIGPQGPAGPPGPTGAPGAKNVKAFGALGNGLADDTAAINAAIEAARVSNTAREVFFPPGSYKIISPGLQMAPGVRLRGLGKLASMLIAGIDDTVLVSYEASALANGFEIQDLGFLSGGFTNVTGIKLDGVANNKRLSLVSLKDLYLNCNLGIYLRFCANVSVQDCFANACHDGFHLNNVADATLSNNQAQNGSGYGFLIEGGPGAFDEGIRLDNCSTNGQAEGLTIIGQDWAQISECSFTTCTGTPIALAGSSNIRISGTDIAAANETSSGLVIDANCSNIQISECLVALNSFGIVLAGSKIGVRGCHFEANQNVDIYITSSRSAVMGNICSSAELPVSILEYGTADSNAITGNVTVGTIETIGANSVSSGNVTA